MCRRVMSQVFTSINVAPSINVRERTVVLNWRGGVVYVRIVYTWRGVSGGPTGDRVTASLNSHLLLYCGVFPIVL